MLYFVMFLYFSPLALSVAQTSPSPRAQLSCLAIKTNGIESEGFMVPDKIVLKGTVSVPKGVRSVIIIIHNLTFLYTLQYHVEVKASYWIYF